MFLSTAAPHKRQHHCYIFDGVDQGTTDQRLSDCEINPGHDKFMTISEFRRKGPPGFVMNEFQLRGLWSVINRTVRVVLHCTSDRRPNTYPGTDIAYPLVEFRGILNLTRFGTGYLWGRCDPHNNIDTLPCPCFKCKSSPEGTPPPAFSSYFEVQTASHVLFDSQEARHAVFEFFYDDEDRKDVTCAYGVGVVSDGERVDTDHCVIQCVVHNRESAQKLWDVEEEWQQLIKETLTSQRSVMAKKFLVSHPHGVAKRVSFGDFTNHKIFLFHKPEFPIGIVAKKGLTVRISGNSNCEDLIKMLNLRPCNNKGDDEQRPVTSSTLIQEDYYRNLRDDDGDDCDGIQVQVPDKDNEPKTFTMLSDVTMVCSPFPVVIHCACDDYLDIENKWWTLPANAKLVEGSGKHVTIPPHPYFDCHEESIKLEVYIKGFIWNNPYFCYNDDKGTPIHRDDWCRYRQYNYNTAACPGSSGARVDHRRRSGYKAPYHPIHFGYEGEHNNNVSGLLPCW